jgi:hypothetical protein
MVGMKLLLKNCVVLVLAIILCSVSVQAEQSRKIEIHDPAWTFCLLGGMAIPLGNTAEYNQASLSTNFEVIYAAAQEMSAGFFVHYSQLPYQSEAASQPLTNLGFGLRAILPIFDLEGINPYVAAGMGYFMTQLATQNVVGHTEQNEPILETKYKSSGGMGFTGGIGFRYKLNPNLSLILEMNVINISLEGGTADSLLFTHAVTGIAYTF